MSHEESLTRLVVEYRLAHAQESAGYRKEARAIGGIAKIFTESFTPRPSRRFMGFWEAPERGWRRFFKARCSASPEAWSKERLICFQRGFKPHPSSVIALRWSAGRGNGRWFCGGKSTSRFRESCTILLR